MKNNEEICYCSDCGKATPCKDLTPLGNKAFCKRCYPYNILQGNAFWIAIVVFTILGILFSGCQDYSYVNKPYVIENIIKTGYDNSICYFSDKHGKKWTIIDSCYKYSVGDTIILKSFKYNSK